MISPLIKQDLLTALGSRINVPVTAYLEARLEEVKRNLIIADEKSVKNLQGRAQELDELLTLAKQARESA